MLDQHIDRLVFYAREGGYVMAALGFGMLVLWAALGYSITVLRRGDNRSLRTIIEMQESGKTLPQKGIIGKAVRMAAAIAERYPVTFRAHLEYELYLHFDAHLGRFSTLIRSIVVAAPLMGLLGTVSGMMETFESLDGNTFQAQSGGIAGGIAEALIATQLGLAVAIPGLLLGKALQRREERLRDELLQLQDLVCARWEARDLSHT